MKRILLSGIVLLGVLSMVPVQAQDRDRDDHHEDRGRDHDGDRDHHSYYDREHRDRHDWDDRESAAWTRYRGEHHVKYDDFARANKRQQADYWRWRHDHPDSN